MAANLELPKLRIADLRPTTRYDGVPRRYDETKPAIAQGFTHRSILNLGTVIHRKTLEKCMLEKEVAVQAAELALWKQAESIREEELEKALKRAKIEQEKVIVKLNRTHERDIREEAIRVEAEMQKLAVDQVQQEKREGEKRLFIVVEKTEKQCHEEMVRLVEEARVEERNIAAQHLAKSLKKEQEKLQREVNKCVDDKARALENLELKLRKEAMQEVAKTREEEQQIAANKLSHMRSLYEQQIIVLQTKIAEVKNEVTRAEKNIMHVLQEKTKIQNELTDMKDEFSDFIKRVQPYNSTESDFIIPSILSPHELDVS